MSETPVLDVTCPPVKVTAYEDRAEVVRSGEVELHGPSMVLSVRNVSPVISDAHVVARLVPVGHGGEAHIDDVRVDRRWVTEGGVPRAREQALKDDIEAKEELVRGAAHRFDRARERRAHAEVVLTRYAELSARGAGQGEGSRAAWTQGFQELARELSTLDHFIAAARQDLAQLTEQVRALRALSSGGPVTTERLVADVVLRASGAPGRYRLVVATLLPCALWRPAHEAHLHGGRVKFLTFATVWQKTGEPWTDVELVLSTARPGAGAVLPPLAEDRLQLRLKTPEERKQVIVEHREEAVPKSESQGQAPGVDDGGVARVFQAMGKVTINDDGRPHRVAVASFEAVCTLERVTYPEVLAQVFLRASLKNAGAEPVLAGPVNLVQDGSWLGVGDVLFVGPGEAFDLSFGTDDRFVVQCKRRRVDEEKLLGKDKVHFVTDAVLSSTAAVPVDVAVCLRLPVSEVKQLKVVPSKEHSTDGVVADEHGVVKIPVKLMPGEEKKVSVGFRFETSGDVRVPDPW